LSDSQRAIIAPLFSPAGNKSKLKKRELVDDVLYLVNNKCKWRNLPHNLPPYTTVANFYYDNQKQTLGENTSSIGEKKVRIVPFPKNRTEKKVKKQNNIKMSNVRLSNN